MKPGEGDKNYNLNDNLLVLSIDNNGKIKFLNRELEKQVGYQKNEVINKRFLDSFLPDYHKGRWINILNNAKNENVLTDFELPLINKQGKQIMVSWDIAPVEDTKLGSIGFVGRTFKENNIRSIESKNSDKMFFRIGNKKIFFRKPFFSSKKNDENLKNIKLPSENSSDSSKNKNDSPSFKKYKPEKLKENINVLDKKMQYLEVLEQENHELKKKLQETKTELSKTKEKVRYLEKKQSSLIKNSQSFLKDTTGFIFDVIGGKKKKEEFEKMMDELDERKQKLKDFEESLNDEKVKLNDGINEFIEWREKLETLEDEVEKRREFLVNREQSVKDNLLSYVDEGVSKKNNISSSDERVDDPSELINNLDSAAVILQRGILKHANKQFLEIIGFSADKILNKSFFDFISSEGLNSFEKYYLDRLKGEPSDCYETVFLTSDKNELPVKVDIKPIFYNGSLVDKLVVVDGSEELKNNVDDSDLSDGNSGELNQEQIDGKVEDAKNEKTNLDEGNNSSSKDKSGDSKNSSDESDGEMNKDDISAMFDKARSEKKDDKVKK